MFYYKVLDEDYNLITVIEAEHKILCENYVEISKEHFDWLVKHGSWFVPM